MVNNIPKTRKHTWTKESKILNDKLVSLFDYTIFQHFIILTEFLYMNLLFFASSTYFKLKDLLLCQRLIFIQNYHPFS